MEPMNIEELMDENARLRSFCTRTIIPNIDLEKENARLKAEVEQARKISGEGMSVTLDLNNQLLAENARLNAEVDDLRQIGRAHV
jgi:nucleoid-associated protein YejK